MRAGEARPRQRTRAGGAAQAAAAEPSAGEGGPASVADAGGRCGSGRGGGAERGRGQPGPGGHGPAVAAKLPPRTGTTYNGGGSIGTGPLQAREGSRPAMLLAQEFLFFFTFRCVAEC